MRGVGSTTKACSSCGTSKPLDEFHSHRGRKDGRQSRCKPCANEEGRAWNAKNHGRRKAIHAAWRAANPEKIKDQGLRRLYGITLEKYNHLLLAQSGLCAICGTDSPGGQKKVFNVEHDHKTGRVRGLLCWDCNTAIGKLGDTYEGVMRAAEYLACEA